MQQRSQIHVRNLLFMATCVVIVALLLRYEPLGAGQEATDAGRLDMRYELPGPREEAERDVAEWKRILLDGSTPGGGNPRLRELRGRIVARGRGGYEAVLRYVPSRHPRSRRAMNELVTSIYVRANAASPAPVSALIAGHLGRDDEADAQYLSLRVLAEPIGRDFEGEKPLRRYWRSAKDGFARRRPVYLRAMALKWLLRHGRIDAVEARDELRSLLATAVIESRGAHALASASATVVWGDALLREMCDSGPGEAVLAAAGTWCRRFHDSEGLRPLAMCLSVDFSRAVSRGALTELRRLTGRRYVPRGVFDDLPDDAEGMSRLRGQWLGWIDRNVATLRWDPATGLFIVPK